MVDFGPSGFRVSDSAFRVYRQPLNPARRAEALAKAGTLNPILKSIHHFLGQVVKRSIGHDQDDITFSTLLYDFIQ